ncbi:MAG: NAD-dependent protein deacetylase [Candidatus Asgardarchaeia archaeon]
MEDQIEKIVNLILDSNFLVALTGAGVSAESGIPTFRGKDGLWKKYRPEDLATPDAFKRNPREVWEWYTWRMKIIQKAKPNYAHVCLAELEKKGILKAIITQNVDGLHQKAGSKNVIELHGNIWRARCTQCDYKEYLQTIPQDIPPKCKKCGSLLRPDVVWFGEPLPTEALNMAFYLSNKADLMLVVGTSLLVQPAASLPFIVLKNNNKIIEINPNETILSKKATITVRMKAAETFKIICKHIEELNNN